VRALLLDEMYPPTLAATAVEVGLGSRSDADVLAWALRNNRCVVTENVSDLARLAGQVAHAGIIFVLAKRFPRTGSGLHRLHTRLDQLLQQKEAPRPGEIRWLSQKADRLWRGDPEGGSAVG
jgi:phage tail tape-measure protein